jgi:hypothetical protein
VFPCPHCHKPIEIGIGTQAKGPWYGIDPGNPKVSLGCGTLILIGIIVAICSGGISDKELEVVRNDIRRVEQRIEDLAAAVKPGAGPAAAEKGIELPP